MTATQIEARAVIVATGVAYRRLEAAGIAELTGRGVYYGADAGDAEQVAGDEVYVVGAANSAGQAALNLARHAKRVVMVVRAAGSGGHHVALPHRPHRGDARHRGARPLPGGGRPRRRPPRRADHRRRRTGARDDVPAGWLFVFIGASPRTEWLGEAVARDERGFVVTGPDLVRGGEQAPRPGRAPYGLETSVPGVFAAGDVRLDSMKRVASAVGEGGMAVHLVHRYLATI